MISSTFAGWTAGRTCVKIPIRNQACVRQDDQIIEHQMFKPQRRSLDGGAHLRQIEYFAETRLSVCYKVDEGNEIGKDR